MSGHGAASGGSLSREQAITAGVIAGLIAGILVAGFLGFFAARKARAGWNLLPVVVAATDLPEGTVLTLDVISQRQMPEQFVSSSVVRPESAAQVVNRRVLAPIQAGDPLLWTHFESRKLPIVLVAAADIPAGAALSEKDVAEKAVPQDLLTPSYVLARDRSQVVGQSVAAPFRRGDPILWTHFHAGSGH